MAGDLRVLSNQSHANTISLSTHSEGVVRGERKNRGVAGLMKKTSPPAATPPGGRDLCSPPATIIKTTLITGNRPTGRGYNDPCEKR